MSVPEMAPLNPEPFGGDGHSRPYRLNLYPPEPVRRRHTVSTKDDAYVDADGTETRVPIDERPARRVKRITSFGVEVIDASAREDQS